MQNRKWSDLRKWKSTKYGKNNYFEKSENGDILEFKSWSMYNHNDNTHSKSYHIYRFDKNGNRLKDEHYTDESESFIPNPNRTVLIELV